MSSLLSTRRLHYQGPQLLFTIAKFTLGAGVGGSIINTHTCTHREKYVINFNSNIFIMLPFLKCTIYLILLRLFSFKFWENTLERKLLNQNFHDNMNEARNGVSLMNLMFLNSKPDFFFVIVSDMCFPGCQENSLLSWLSWQAPSTCYLPLRWGQQRTMFGKHVAQYLAFIHLII